MAVLSPQRAETIDALAAMRDEIKQALGDIGDGCHPAFSSAAEREAAPAPIRRAVDVANYKVDQAFNLVAYGKE